MATTVPLDIEPLYQLHEQLLELDERLNDLGLEATPVERQIAESLRSIGQRMIDLVEDVLDSQESRLAMEDVRRHGAVPWEQIEATTESASATTV